MSEIFGSFASIFERLSTTRPFSCLSLPQLEHAIQSSRVEFANIGETIIDEGEGGCDYVVLLEGELEVTRRYINAEGMAELEIGCLRPGEGAGEMALLQGLPRQASVRAMCDSRYLRIDGERMEELLAWSQCFSNELNDLAEIRARMNLVRQVGPFRLLPLENVQRAFEALRPMAVARNTFVVHQGEKGDVYYVIERGAAEVWRYDPLSGVSACVAVLGPGDAFGEEALLIGGFRNATVKMTSNGWLWMLDKQKFDALVKHELIEELSATQAQQLAQENEVRWLDCRYDVEFEEGCLPGAIHVPLDSIRERSDTLDKSYRYIVYCHSGRRSVCAAYLLSERGFTASSLTGGLRDWPFAVARNADEKHEKYIKVENNNMDVACH
jgi:CRP-like cAMP-binding protein